MEQGALVAALVTTVGTLFVTELTDKDALFLLALATRTNALVVFAAGSLAFTITSAIIVVAGALLLSFVPVIAIKLAGGAIMLLYALWEYLRFSSQEREVEEREERVLDKRRTSVWSIFFPALVSLIVLDLAGDATELVTVVLLAHFQDIAVVFSGAVIGLVAATAVETALGNKLGAALSPERVKYLSIVVFVVIGTTVIVTSLLSP